MANRTSEYKPVPVGSETAITDGGTPVADRIRERILEAGDGFHANHNICAHLQEGDLDALQSEVEAKMVEVLRALVIDTENDHNTQETARRVAKMYLREVFGGRYVPEPRVTEFPNVSRLNELMIVGPVTVRSACSHHLCPIIGRIWVGVMPNEHSALIGLSKYARLVEWVMTRPQIQEEAINQLAETPPGEDAARRPGHRDGGRPLLHAMARGEGHGLEDDQLHHARLLPQRLQPAPGVPGALDQQEGLEPMLVRLLYASRAVDGIDEAFLRSILEQARANNLEHGITGILCTYPEGGVFIQLLEGGRETVNRLYGNIVRDRRHSDVTILDFAEIEERRFASWRMGNVDLKKVNRSSILRYSEKIEIDPFSMSGQSALALLEELASSASVASYDGS